MHPVIILLSREGFDPSEAAVPWQALRRAGIEVRFASPDGQPGNADPLMVTGEGLDPWARIPGLKRLRVIGRMLGANHQARTAYADMIRDPHYLAPLRYADIRATDYAGLLLPGGHAKPIRPYLESTEVQRITREFLQSGDGQRVHKPVAAICHGVLILARTRDDNGHSVVRNRQLTALTWTLEHKAWQVARFSRFWEPLYYRTYPEATGEPLGHQSTEAEIRRALATPEHFLDVPKNAPDHWHKTSGIHRDTAKDSRAAWVVEDGNLITARWPGDVNLFAQRFIAALQRFHALPDAGKPADIKLHQS